MDIYCVYTAWSYMQKVVKFTHKKAKHRTLVEFLMGHLQYDPFSTSLRGRRSRDHMVVGFTTTFAIGAYHH